MTASHRFLKELPYLKARGNISRFWWNVNVICKPSTIIEAGYGLFANTRIVADTELYRIQLHNINALNTDTIFEDGKSIKLNNMNDLENLLSIWINNPR